MDEDSDETVMMPMRLHSIGDNLYLLYQLYRESSRQVYLDYELNDDGGDYGWIYYYNTDKGVIF